MGGRVLFRFLEILLPMKEDKAAGGAIHYSTGRHRISSPPDDTSV
jgi:hypothetical protein